MKRTRPTKIRKPKKVLYILCEGEKTEINYFDGLFYSIPENNEKYSLQVYKPQNHSPYGIVKQCASIIKNAKLSKMLRSDIEVWAVFDRNGHDQIETAF